MKSNLFRKIAATVCFAALSAIDIFPQSVRYNGDVELGVVATRDYADAQVDLSTTHGAYFIKPKLFVGAGAALGWNIQGEFWNKVYPVYGDIRKDFTLNRLFTAFIDAKAGYSFQGGLTGMLGDCGIDYGFYCCPSAGVRLTIREPYGVYVKIGYTYQDVTLSYFWIGEHVHEGSSKKNAGGFSASVGFSF